MENENKIMLNNRSIEKNKLFALCNEKWDIARVGMTMLLMNHLKMKPMEAYEMANQLRPEREAFYNLI